MTTTADQTPAAAPGRAPLRAGARYNLLSMSLHWAIAALILVQIGLGWDMNEWLPDHSKAQAAVTTLHVSVGLTILLLVVVRIVTRIAYPPPPLPASLAPWERGLARFTHVLFYVLMLVLPLTGWALVSVGPSPIALWGLPWPHLPGLAFLHAPAHRPDRHLLMQIHTNYLIWIILLNLALHVAGALKHQFGGDPVLWRMTPGRKA
jgi:cytochrome b561